MCHTGGLWEYLPSFLQRASSPIVELAVDDSRGILYARTAASEVSAPCSLPPVGSRAGTLGRRLQPCNRGLSSPASRLAAAPHTPSVSHLRLRTGSPGAAKGPASDALGVGAPADPGPPCIHSTPGTLCRPDTGLVHGGALVPLLQRVPCQAEELAPLQIVMFDLGAKGTEGPHRKAECTDLSKAAASCSGGTTEVPGRFNRAPAAL